ncbi:MAG: UvrD-helicase domain-containing protein [Clostridia bacterium]|nr:UvrD-helicase domain-containing protein [Clostridia bacterium]
MRNVLIDQTARDAIRTDLSTTIIVEAGAGSGKTSSLVERIIALLETEEATVDQIAAITFTRKAAGELKERVQEELEKRLLKITSEQERIRLETALLDLECGFIGTIHSFCERLLREQPVEAGLDPEFETVEEGEEGPLADQVWREYLMEMHHNDEARILEIEEMGLTLEELKFVYDRLCRYPEVEFPCSPASTIDVDPPLAALNQFLEQVAPLIPPSPIEDRRDGLQNAILEIQQVSAHYDLRDRRQFSKVFGSLNRGLKVIQKLWSSKAEALAARDAFDQFRQEVVEPVMEGTREYRYATLIPFVLPAVQRLGERREALSRLNFQDLLIRTARALKENPEMRRYLQARYTRLLVDEFQDTDPIQAEMVFYLTGQDCHEKDWRKLVPRPGSLFVVGDPKQSIYRFRRADIDTYNLVKKLIVDGGGRLLHLDTNFRSVPSLAEFINPVFESAFPVTSTDFQASYAPMHTVREPATGALNGVYRISIPDAQGQNNKEGVAQRDAARIARWIRWALDSKLPLSRKDKPPSPIRPDDVLILLRYRDGMEIYARALDEQGIPYSITGGSGVQAVPPLAEAHTLLTVLSRPDDPVNLVAALRGPFFGFSDQELWEYREAGGRFSIFASVPEDDLRPEVKAVFTAAFEKLKTYHRWSRTMPPAAAVSSILSESGLLPWVLSEPPARSGAANTLLLRELLGEYESAGETTFSSLVQRFGELLETGTENGLDLDAGSRGAVRLMNLHKAKGLEAPVVFLAHPGKKVSKDPDLHIDRTTDPPCGYLQVSKPGPYGNGPIIATPPDWTNLQQIEAKYQDAEEVRLVYVAATRAKDLLVVSTFEKSPDKSPWSLLNAALQDVPELDDPEEIQATVDDPAPDAATVTVADYQTLQTVLATTWDAVKSPSYAVQSVTVIAKEADAPTRHGEGRGMSWGSAVHRMLEKLVRGVKGLEAWAAKILEEEGRPVSEAGELLALLEEIQKTDFWRRVEAASERIAEAPLSGLLPTTSPTGRELPTVTQGVIDLAFEEEAGWVLVDFKTDHYETLFERNALVNYYASQLKAYAELWKQATGEAPTELGLFFTHKKEHVICSES